MPYQISNSGYSLPVQVSLANCQGVRRLHMLNAISRKQTVSPAITWNAVVSGGTSAWVSTSADAGSATSPVVATAQLPIATQRLEEVFSINANEVRTAAAYGAEQLKNLLATNIAVAANTLAMKLEDSIINGGGSLVGLKQLFATVAAGKSTAVYAGIDPATYGNWTNLVSTNATDRALTLALIDAIDLDIRSGSTIGSASDYDMILTSPAFVAKYKALYTAVQLPTTGGTGVYDIGSQFAAYAGRPLRETPYMSMADGAYFIDSSQLTVHTFAEATQPDVAPLTVGSDTATDLLGFELFKKPQTNPDQMDFALILKPQLQVANRFGVALLNKILA